MTKKLLETCVTIAKHYLPKHCRLKEGYKHFSFVIQNNKLIEWSTNKSGPPQKYNGYAEHTMLHSETLAYKRAKGLLNKKESFQVINIRLSSKGELKISKPCPCCTSFLRNLNCRSIYYSQSSSDLFQKIIL